MVLLGSGTSKVSKETQPEWLDPTRHWQARGDASYCIVSSVFELFCCSFLTLPYATSDCLYLRFRQLTDIVRVTNSSMYVCMWVCCSNGRRFTVSKHRFDCSVTWSTQLATVAINARSFAVITYWCGVITRPPQRFWTSYVPLYSLSSSSWVYW